MPYSTECQMPLNVMLRLICRFRNSISVPVKHKKVEQFELQDNYIQPISCI